MALAGVKGRVCVVEGGLVDLVQTGLGLAILKMDGQFAHSAGFRLVLPLVRFRVSFCLFVRNCASLFGELLPCDLCQEMFPVKSSGETSTVRTKVTTYLSTSLVLSPGDNCLVPLNPDNTRQLLSELTPVPCRKPWEKSVKNKLFRQLQIITMQYLTNMI